MQAYANAANRFIKRTWSEVAIPTAWGIVAHAQGNWEKATLELGSTLSCLHALGGSHAQRDLFEQVYLDAWLKRSENLSALRLLEKRVAAHRYVPSIELMYNQQKVIQLPARKAAQVAATVSPPSNLKTEEKQRITINSDQATHWTDELSHSQGLALAKTYARIVAMGGYIGV
jgi:hypothetical protein